MTKENCKFFRKKPINNTKLCNKSKIRFTWGSGEHGQLGHKEVVKEKSSKSYEITRNYMQSSVFSKPKKVEVLTTLGKKVVQVACGTFHTVFSSGK